MLAHASEDETALATALVRSFLPVTARHAGVANEGAAIDPAARYMLGTISVPTLVVHARDDGLNPFAIGEHAASEIPGAQFVALDEGGHLLIGQSAAVRKAVRELLARSGGR